MSRRLIRSSTTLRDGWLTTRWEFDDGGALTQGRFIGDEIEAEAAREMPQMHRTGAAEIARLEAESPTRQAAEDLTTEWDRVWGNA